MRARTVVFAAFLLASPGARHPLAAQEPAPPSQLTLDASPLAAGLSYAHVNSAGNLAGFGAGLGYEFNIRLVLGESGGRKSTEIAHIEMFTRTDTPGRWQYDLGIKAAIDIHSAQVASEADIGGFLGGYIAPMWGGRHFRVGPRAQTGVYWSASGPTLGLFITPLTARILF